MFTGLELKFQFDKKTIILKIRFFDITKFFFIKNHIESSFTVSFKRFYTT